MRKNFKNLPASLALAMLAPCAAMAAQESTADDFVQQQTTAVSGLTASEQGQFALRGDTELADVLDAYGLALPKAGRGERTIADLFDRAHPAGSRVGSKVSYGPLAFVARKVVGGRVTMSGLLVGGQVAKA